MAQTLSPADAPARTTYRWELPDLVLRSPEATWNFARWETLPADGNRYEVIDGVLYMTTAPKYLPSIHQQTDRAGAPDLDRRRRRRRDLLGADRPYYAGVRPGAARSRGRAQRRPPPLP